MVETKMIALGLLGIYVVILANIGIADGDLMTVTTVDPLVSVEDVTTDGGETMWIDTREGDADNAVLNVTPSEEEIQQETTTTASGGIDCVCDCSGQDRECLTLEECTAKSQEIAAGENDNSDANGETVKEEAASTTEAIVDTNDAEVENETTTSVPTEDKPTTEESAKTEEDTSTAAPSPSPPPPSPAPLCDTPGVQPDESDCRAYHDCTSVGYADGSNHLVTKFCASNEAFNVEFKRCSRDISSCPIDVNCQLKGGVADPLSNSSYYLCEPRLIGGGFLIFHVKCSANQLFYPELGKCFIDVNNLPQPPYPAFPPFYWNQIEDIDIVKAELKLIKEQDKLKLKAEKERLKAEKKLQKEIQKEAEQRAKEEEKLKKELAKQESSTFVCPEVGSFASNVSDTIYYMCVSKKDKFKVVVMQCPIGSKFNASVGICSIDNSQVNNHITESDDDDNDDDDNDED